MTDAPEPGPPQSPGAILRAAREARGLTVDEVAGRLRLRPHLVEALERDDLAALGAGPYGRGQLRNYAHLVGIPEERVVPPAQGNAPRRALAAAGSGLRRPSLAPPPRPRWPLRALSAGVFGIIGVLAIVWALGSGREAPPPPDPGLVQAPAAVSPPAPPPPGSPPPPAGGPSSAATPAPGVQVAPLALPPAQPAPGVPAQPGAPPAVQSAPVGAGAELALRFSGPCWVEVTDAAGARLLYRMARAGDRHVLSGSPPFAVTLGNAREVEITYNGAPFPKPNTARPVVRLTVGG